MTAFIMHCCRKTDVSAFLIGCLSFFFISLLWAASNSLHIRKAELVPSENAYLLNADFSINFNDETEAALNKGVALHFLIEFQLVAPVSYWFDDEIANASTNVSLSYHALSRQYLVTRGTEQSAFHTLQEAMQELAHLRGWRVFDKGLVVKGEPYYAALRMRLDQSKLPKPMQVEALSSDEWSLVSERHRWLPELF